MTQPAPRTGEEIVNAAFNEANEANEAEGPAAKYGLDYTVHGEAVLIKHIERALNEQAAKHADCCVDREEMTHLRTALAEIARALEWTWRTMAENLKPWGAWTEYGDPQREGFHCWGCGGEFVSVWPTWEQPTDQTFPHEPTCEYVKARKLLTTHAAAIRGAK